MVHAPGMLSNDNKMHTKVGCACVWNIEKMWHSYPNTYLVESGEPNVDVAIPSSWRLGKRTVYLDLRHE